MSFETCAEGVRVNDNIVDRLTYFLLYRFKTIYEVADIRSIEFNPKQDLIFGQFYKICCRFCDAQKRQKLLPATDLRLDLVNRVKNKLKIIYKNTEIKKSNLKKHN